MKISIITPTIRKEGLNVIRDSLRKQTFRDFEWLIGSKFDPEQPDAKWIVDDFTDGYWTLNRIYNKLFRAAKGELIVSWQDWINVRPDALEKFIINYEATGEKTIISGIGDQYESLDKFGNPQVKIWSDPRRHLEYGSFYECFPNDAEWNWCMFPKKAIYEIGGMDEELDFLGYGGDQLQANERMDELGWKFYLDQSNQSYTVRHTRDDYGGQEKWDKNHVILNGKYDQRKRELKATGKWPVLNYLKENDTI